MDIVKQIRYFVIISSLIIFCYQFSRALHHLLGWETVDSTEHILVSHLDSPPVLTFCPRQDKNIEKFYEYGYMSRASDLLKGKS